MRGDGAVAIDAARCGRVVTPFRVGGTWILGPGTTVCVVRLAYGWCGPHEGPAPFTPRLRAFSGPTVATGCQVSLHTFFLMVPIGECVFSLYIAGKKYNPYRQRKCESQNLFTIQGAG